MIDKSDKILGNIHDVRLFGSYARNESQSDSDVDILAIIDRNSNFNKTKLVEKLKCFYKLDISLSIYSKRRISEMFNAGHLFAWHLFNESESLINGMDYLRDQNKPRDYNHFVFDFNSIYEILLTIGNQINEYPSNIIYEAGLIYLCARNISISASWYSSNGLSFGRYAPYTINIRNIPSFPILKENYDKLIQSRQASMRGTIAPRLDKKIVLENYRQICDWSLRLKKSVEDEYIKISN